MNTLAFNLATAYQALTDAYSTLAASGQGQGYTWEDEDDMAQLKIAIERIEYVASVNKIKFK